LYLKIELKTLTSLCVYFENVSKFIKIIKKNK